MKSLCFSFLLCLPGLTAIGKAGDDSEYTSKDSIYTRVDKLAAFAENTSAYISRNLRLPDSIQWYHFKSRVVLRFTIWTDGSVRDVHVYRPSGNQKFDNACKEMVEKMPKWKPAQANGKPVASYYALPIQICFN